MVEEDAEAVREVEAAGFGAYLEKAKGITEKLPCRTRANILALREHDPEGCFVAEEEGRVVGFIFSRTWGSVGWFGTFAVQPERQGRGIGRRLVTAAVDYLRRDPDRLIGLETMPDSPTNLGLYLRLGFQVRLLSLHVSKPLDGSLREGVGLARWSAADAETRKLWLRDLREATDQIRPGLDYSKEILSTARHGLGDTLILAEGGRAVGMSTVRLVGNRVGEEESDAAAHPLMVHPAHTDEDRLQALLEASEALAGEHGKRALTVPVNARHTWALERILESGYRVKGAYVRMILAGTERGPRTDDYVNLSRWAG
jgi:ribosomal protein S18 acetylase RimI-like enzyme